MIPLIFLIIILFLLYNFFLKKVDNQNRKIAKERLTLKIKYDEALKGSDKRYALECGRLYYASMRKDGRLSVYDETALTNDLATMEVIDNENISNN